MAWMTRKQVRSQPVKSHGEKQLEKLLSRFDKRMQRLNDEYLRLMGEHIRDIGKLWPSDVHRLQQIRRMNRNLAALERKIGRAAGQSAGEIETVFRSIAEEDARMQTRILGMPDILSVSSNPPLRRILEAQARETAGRMANLSNTTVVSKYYRSAVDEAVSAVQSGVEDYNTAIRRVIRDAGQHGLRVTEDGVRKVDYESGWSRRLDSAARMNVLDGVRHLNQSIMEDVSRQFGADGVEIDAHMLCAEDHLPYQGGQYTNEEFEEIQDSLARPFGEWNCRHSWHGIILGVSPPTYTPEQLEEMQRYSTEELTIDGRTKTRYQWTQEMRRCESAIRRQKDTATLARMTGDQPLQRRCQGQIGALNDHYRQLAGKVGVAPEFNRTYVAGFRDAGAQVSEKERLRTQNSNSVSTKALDFPGYKDKFNGITGIPEVDAAIHRYAKEILTHRDGSNKEDLYLIDGKTGDLIHALTTSNSRNSVVYDAETTRAIDEAHKASRTIVSIHNHPNGLPPTMDDGVSARIHGYSKGVAVGHNLEVFEYNKTDKEYSTEFCQRIHAKIAEMTVFNVDFEEDIWYTVLRKYGMEVKRR